VLSVIRLTVFLLAAVCSTQALSAPRQISKITSMMVTSKSGPDPSLWKMDLYCESNNGGNCYAAYIGKADIVQFCAKLIQSKRLIGTGTYDLGTSENLLVSCTVD